MRTRPKAYDFDAWMFATSFVAEVRPNRSRWSELVDGQVVQVGRVSDQVGGDEPHDGLSPSPSMFMESRPA